MPATTARWRPTPASPEGGAFEGRDSLRRFFAGVHQGWRGSDIATLKYAQRAGDSVLTAHEWHATGELSGMDVSSEWFALWTIRDDRIARLR
jgi:ketosteroid isomerase-like protein